MKWPGIIVLLTGLFLSGCIPASSIQPVADLASVGESSVVVVGRFFLEPKLEAHEQDLGSYDEYRNSLIVVTDTRLRDASSLGWGDLDRRIETEFGRYFFMEMPREDFYILKAWVLMNTDGTGNAPLEGRFHVDIEPDDRVVYIGDITYHRDTFFRTMRINVTDALNEATAAARKHFGERVTLRKAFVSPVERQ